MALIVNHHVGARELAAALVALGAWMHEPLNARYPRSRHTSARLVAERLGVHRHNRAFRSIEQRSRHLRLAGAAWGDKAH
jgi:hypothetical protein